MRTYNFSTIQVEDWQGFKNQVLPFSENWAFRGQSNGNWLLNNAIERTEFIHHSKNVEAEFVAEFQRGARNYLSKDETPTHLIEWLALMQHHGAPTRLLDLTKSPFVAAYFAFERCSIESGHHIAIWCINVAYLKKRATEQLAKEFGEALTQSGNLIKEDLFEKIFYDNKLKLVFPVEPFRMNRRYSLQQSIFLSTGMAAAPLMEQLDFLGDEMQKAVVKIEVPSCNKKAVLRELQLMNLNRASLFPDLDGYALSMRLRYDSMRSPEELLTHSLKKLEDKSYPFIP